MSVTLTRKSTNSKATVNLPASKSISNRALILQALMGDKLSIFNLSEANDTQVLQQALKNSRTTNTIDIQDAGTAMRFLTSFLAITPGKYLLKGTQRMHERPIGILVDALRELDAEINYPEYAGFPPIEIEGKKLKGGEIRIDSSVSSQYITSLLLIAAFLETGLTIILKGEASSKPYIDMTLALLSKVNIQCSQKQNTITILPLKQITNTTIVIENDWSAASYWYELAALSDEAEIHLNGLELPSIQGDSVVAKIFKKLGVSTRPSAEGLIIKKGNEVQVPDSFSYDFSNYPDLAQTLAATCAGLGIKATLTGLSSLKLKETDRLVALKTELEKMGAIVQITKDSLVLIPSNKKPDELLFNTYKDHRMAMCLAPLVMKYNSVTIDEPSVVNKSYPSFWEEFKKVGSLQLAVGNNQ